MLTIGDVIFDAVFQTMAATFETEEGQETLRELMALSLDGLVEELTGGEVEALVREIALDAIEHVKDAVRVRKWIDSEAPIRPRISDESPADDSEAPEDEAQGEELVPVEERPLESVTGP